ncbi:MAG: protein-S-isoprenylcysteine methyltransferase [unclassified Hahellaceae]|nr:protein-S-isoprenylcysteine methyltransferase [Hahellaceae bacterium]|tara:strand:+ start:38586 stop:39047 length:462 start_codon:yes stop_codon:yes gene_type:complete
MAALDKKIPPLVLLGAAAAGMWGLSMVLPGFALPNALRLLTAMILLVAGDGVCLAGVVEFSRARTSVDPRKPEASSSLVTSGIYSVTRNPMYVGFTSILLAWAAWLSSPWSLLIVGAFVVYLDRFQIQPEERALEEIFGHIFADYCRKVRRWI